ncbi:MAG: hypothetical protein Kow00108_06170 [Calditrichia bacterium]
MKNQIGNLIRCSEEELFKITLGEKAFYLKVESGFGELYIKNAFQPLLITPGDIISIPDQHSAGIEFISGTAFVELTMQHVPDLNSIEHLAQFRIYSPMEGILLKPKIVFDHHFINTLFAILKILDWHDKDNPRQPLSLNVLKIECKKLNVTSEPLLMMLLNAFAKLDMISFMAESAVSIRHSDSFSSMLKHIRNITTTGIYDPWYLHHIQKYILKFFLLFQHHTISDEISFDQEEFEDLLTLIPISRKDINTLLSEWKNKKFITIKEEQSEEDNQELKFYSFKFSKLQNLWTLLRNDEDVLSLFIRLYHYSQEFVITRGTITTK